MKIRNPICIVAKSGFTRGRLWTLRSEPIFFGRSTECDIVIDDDTVSRKHCAVQTIDGAVMLRDLGSRNPSLVNGAPLLEGMLAVGDEIAIGPAVFIVANGDSTFARRAGSNTGAGESDTKPIASLRLRLSVDDNSRLLDQLPVRQKDYVFLVHLSHQLSQCDSVERLTDTLSDMLHKHLGTSGVALALLRNPERLVGEPIPKSEHNALWDAAQTVADSSDFGVLELQLGDEGVRYVAPVRCGNEVHAAFIVHRPDRSHGLDNDDMTLLTWIGTLVGPYVDGIQRQNRLHELNRRLTVESAQALPLIGKSRVMHELREAIRQAAESELNVLILGETGTGKELIARGIHDVSPRRDHPYVILNCAAIPNELFESELFGHVRGAFTGADFTRRGLIDTAAGGTVFLDEVGDLSPENQARLLRVVENGVYRAVGRDQELETQVRFIAATNRDVGSGALRDDLYHRLAGMTIHAPPLHARKSDAPLLAQHFIDRLCANSDELEIGLTEDARKFLRSEEWPGNVRQLRQCVERAVYMVRQGEISAELLERIHGTVDASSAMPIITLRELERSHIETALAHTKGNMTQVAKLLGISRSTLYVKVKELGLSRTDGEF